MLVDVSCELSVSPPPSPDEGHGAPLYPITISGMELSVYGPIAAAWSTWAARLECADGRTAAPQISRCHAVKRKVHSRACGP